MRTGRQRLTPFDDLLEANGNDEPAVAQGIDWSQTEDRIESYRRWAKEFVAEPNG